MTDDWMRREEVPCRRLPKPVNGSGPSVYLMELEAAQRQREGQAMLWAGEFDGVSDSGPRCDLSDPTATVA
jgi:hypothetical protein